MPTVAEAIAHIVALRAVEPKRKGRSKDFYASQAWKRLRYQVLRESNGCCVVCGRSAKDGIVLHVDHRTPLSKDFSKRLDKNNLQVMCGDCNLGKSNTDSIDWRRQDDGAHENSPSRPQGRARGEVNGWRGGLSSLALSWRRVPICPRCTAPFFAMGQREFMGAT